MSKCCDIKIGELNRKITIRQLTNTPDGQGGFESDSWSNFAQPWARLKPMKGGEKVHADRLTTNQLTQCMIRYISGITTKMQVLYNGDEYQIRSIVNVDEANEWLELMLERVVTQ